jgi:antirestriction protein ArdC
LLACCKYESPYWLTFKQAKQLSGSVKKGEKSMPVVFWKWNEVEDAESGKPKQVPILRYYNVFNLAQCELPEAKQPPALEVETHDFSPIDACESLVREMPKAPAIKHDTVSAFYRPSSDQVHMPPAERFEKPGEYYSTLFHELTHATGHESRLHRDGICEVSPFGSRTYSKEELIAEMGAAFLCGHCGIEDTTIDNSAAYIQGWLKKLRGDSRLVVHAAAAAQKAADFILGRKDEQD